MNVIENAIILATTYKAYLLGGRNLECSPEPSAKYRTAVPDYKLRDIAELVEKKKNIKGDILEVGVWRGGVGILLGSLIKNVPIYLVDTFSGIPSVSPKDTYHEVKDFDDCSFEEVSNIFKDLNMANVFVLKGEFPLELAGSFEDKKFSIVHLDVDTYKSYKECLNFLYPKLTKDGIILLDDYLESSCAGATLAINEFSNETNIDILLYNHTYYIEK